MAVRHRTPAELNRLFKHWAPRLRLSNWDIAIRWGTNEEMDGCVGKSYIKPEHLVGEILIAKPESKGKGMHEDLYKNVELTVVHELLHFVMVQLYSRIREHPTLDDMKEQVIEQIAKALLEV